MSEDRDRKRDIIDISLLALIVILAGVLIVTWLTSR